MSEVKTPWKDYLGDVPMHAQPFLHDTFDDPRPVHGVNHPVAYLIHTGPSFPNDFCV